MAGRNKYVAQAALVGVAWFPLLIGVRATTGRASAEHCADSARGEEQLPQAPRLGGIHLCSVARAERLWAAACFRAVGQARAGMWHMQLVLPCLSVTIPRAYAFPESGQDC